MLAWVLLPPQTLRLAAIISRRATLIKPQLRAKTLPSPLALLLYGCHIGFAFPRRQTSLVHCWKSIENVQWHTHTAWLPPALHQSVFIRSRLGFYYLELLMQRGHVNLELEADVGALRLSHSGSSNCTASCQGVNLITQKKHFIHDAFRFIKKSKDFSSCF